MVIKQNGIIFNFDHILSVEIIDDDKIKIIGYIDIFEETKEDIEFSFTKEINIKLLFQLLAICIAKDALYIDFDTLEILNLDGELVEVSEIRNKKDSTYAIYN